MDRRTSIPLVSIHHHPAKIEPGTSEGSESWRIPAEATTNNPYTFGHYKPAKSYDERALDPTFFTDPTMKMPSGPSTAQPPIGYYNAAPPVGYERNGLPHHSVNFNNPMQPNPHDYSMTMMQNQNGNGVRNVQPQYHTTNSNRPTPVPTPQAMMTTFSSKTVSSTPKRYKCNICQKRFTRPSSLQTHTYSHTGEKRKLNFFKFTIYCYYLPFYFILLYFWGGLLTSSYTLFTFYSYLLIFCVYFSSTNCSIQMPGRRLRSSFLGCEQSSSAPKDSLQMKIILLPFFFFF